ncbi:methyltransferase domain-containing protein [Amycolatopsis sp. NPDC059027]|uniref:methyltransferase domain-containing protein n=1 Tax=Amycolatopsis sp. NPDC059027 TaxID=3346709 RepID=UPI00366CAF32
MSSDVSDNWFETFFTELPNEFWRRVATTFSTEDEVDFIVRRLGLTAGSRVLDVPCGSGRHSLELAARGHRVRGIDISSEAIDHARKRAAERDLDVDLAVAEMRELPNDGAYDAVVCMGNSFGYLDIEALRDFVAGMAATVRPGGGIVVDVGITAESVLPGFVDAERSAHQVGDIEVESVNTYDVERSAIISHDTFRRGAAEVTATAVHRIYTSAHLGQLLTEAGFVDVARFAGPTDEPYRFGDSQLMMTAQLPG